MTTRKMPIGVQDFEKPIKEKFVYVDKTAIAYNLVKTAPLSFFPVRADSGRAFFFQR